MIFLNDFYSSSIVLWFRREVQLDLFQRSVYALFLHRTWTARYIDRVSRVHIINTTPMRLTAVCGDGETGNEARREHMFRRAVAAKRKNNDKSMRTRFPALLLCSWPAHVRARCPTQCSERLRINAWGKGKTVVHTLYVISSWYPWIISLSLSRYICLSEKIFLFR